MTTGPECQVSEIIGLAVGGASNAADLTKPYNLRAPTHGQFVTIHKGTDLIAARCSADKLNMVGAILHSVNDSPFPKTHQISRNSDCSPACKSSTNGRGSG